jgi:hypothetical protein
MVIIDGLLIKVISIILQYPLNPLYPVVKDEFQFRSLNFTQKYLNGNEKILWPGGLSFCHAPFMYRKSEKSESTKSGL